jgi:predicted Rossmann-fold nucleotide-binding protein
MTKKFHSVCVYCGSAKGNNPVYADAAKALGRALVKHNLSLVYGGGHVGLMGIVADAHTKQIGIRSRLTKHRITPLNVKWRSDGG